MRDIGRNFDLPLMANMVEGGATPVLTPDQLAGIGYQVAIFPASGFLAVTQALTNVYQSLQDQGAATATGTQLYDFKDFTKLMGFEEIMEFEARYE